MRDDRVRLLDIQEAIERIEKYARQGQEAFEQEELIQTWSSTICKSSVRQPARSLLT
jgi:uncharacterized protein with HEPN domain